MSQIQDNVDGAFESFEKLFAQISSWSGTITSEEDVRLKVIDPFFVEVLGWAPGCIQTEEPTGEGFLDYKFNIDDSARLVVEAKRESLSFGLEGRTGGRAYKLNGPVLSAKPVPRDGILQAINYGS